MEFLEHEYLIVAKILSKTRKVTIPMSIAQAGDTIFIIVKRKD